MRVAFFLLVLVNLAFFAWAQWLAPGEAQVPVSPKVDAPRLQLATEASPTTANGNCVTLGPFATNELAARARQTLTDSGYPSVPREQSSSVLDSYWVYLESPSTEAAERRLLERLRRGGISEAQPIGDAGTRKISLGIFNDETRAFSQSERVAKLGLLPQIESRQKDSTSIWLDLKLKTGGQPLEGKKFQAGEAELEFRPCPVAQVGDDGEDAGGADPQ